MPKKGLAGEKPNNVDIHSEYEIRKIENREKTNARPMEKFLDSLSKGKKKSYRRGRGLDAFFEATRPKKDPIDEAEARRYPNLRDVDPNLVRSGFRDNKPREPQEPHDPYLEEIRECEKQEGQEETERINKLDRRKLREWLESEEQD